MNNKGQKPSKGYSNGNEKRYKSVAAAMGGGANGSSANNNPYLDCDPAALHHLLCVVTNEGGAIMFSRDKEGHGISVTIFLGDERIKAYLVNTSEISRAIYDYAEKLLIALDNS